MRPHAFVEVVVSIILIAQAGILRAQPGKETESERIARLIKQLGDGSFAKREAASKELEAIGAVLAALKQAATSSDDLEIRQRAARILQTIAFREAEATAKAELAKLQGTWTLVSYEACGKPVKGEDSEYSFTVTGDKFVLKESGPKGRTEVGTLRIVETSKGPKAFDQIHAEGPAMGTTISMIFQVEGDRLKFCWSDLKVRPTEFSTNEDNRRGVQTYKRK